MARTTPVRRTAAARRSAAWALVAAMAVVLGACGAGPDDGASGPDVEATGGTSGTGQPVVHDLPDADVAVSISTPSDWDESTQDGTFFLRSREGFGDPSFAPNVVVTTKAASATTLAEEAQTATAFVAGLDGWATDTDSQGALEVGGLPAYRISGTFEARGVEVAQSETIVAVVVGDQTAFAYLTASHAVGDETGQAQTEAAVASAIVGPPAP